MLNYVKLQLYTTVIIGRTTVRPYFIRDNLSFIFCLLLTPYCLLFYLVPMAYQMLADAEIIGHFRRFTKLLKCPVEY